jgi:hypothetical protein
MKDATGSVPVTGLASAVTGLASAILNTHRHTHASVVMTTVAILEYQLERALKTTLHHLNASMNKRLFEGYGPLSTFAAKIDVAYVLNTISKDTYDELIKIKAIRNKMAHSRTSLSLDVDPMRPLFDKLKRPPGDTSKTYSEAFMRCGLVISDSIEQYLFAHGVTEDIAEKNKVSQEGSGHLP